ncbi:hypothetical protein MNV49_001350 [Pseudohyphozyma bogoriensis]|nr:hypothetical protein MNV49_001350 [Pseudohyphozyma bogoriensis]
MAPLSSLVGMPLSTLKATIATAFGVQAACSAFYDLAGSATFIGCTLVSLYYPALRSKAPWPKIGDFHPRQLVMSAFTVLWAGRLGSFLFQRIHKAGSDSRFDEIKKSPPKFAAAWFMQGVWVSLTALPVYAVNAIPKSAQPPLGPRDAFAAALWISAFAFEVVADRQKSAWRDKKEKKQHDEKFITSGLWSLSRHPNYVGEVGLWAGHFLAAQRTLSFPGVSGVLYPPWLAMATLASPVMEYGLIRFISGVPMLEASGDKKFGDDPKWKEYKKNTPVFFPNLW